MGNAEKSTCWENIVVTLESFLKTQTSEQEEKDSVPSEKTLFVKRMGGRDNRAEHYPGSNKLPHIMLEVPQEPEKQHPSNRLVESSMMRDFLQLAT